MLHEMLHLYMHIWQYNSANLDTYTFSVVAQKLFLLLKPATWP